MVGKKPMTLDGLMRTARQVWKNSLWKLAIILWLLGVTE
jgi:hypothetical protein